MDNQITNTHLESKQDAEIQREMYALEHLENPDQDTSGGVSLLGCLFLYTFAIGCIGLVWWLIP